MNAFEVCLLYRGLKLHFNTPYDFVKYNGKVNYTVKNFEQSRYKYVYEKIAKEYSDNQIKDFFISNFLHNEQIWIHELLSVESKEIYIRYLKNKQSLSYVFSNDIDKLFLYDNIKNLVLINKNDYPKLIKLFFRNEITLETLTILDNFFNFFKKWNIEEDIIYPRLKTKVIKYKPLLEYDKEKFKGILTEKIKRLDKM